MINHNRKEFNMLVSPIRENVNFNGFHQGTRKILSKESQNLLDRGIQEITSVYNEVKGIRRGKGSFQLAGDSVTLSTVSGGKPVELTMYNSNPDMKYQLRMREEVYNGDEKDLRNWSYVEFDKSSGSEKVNYRDVAPFDVYRIYDFRKLDESDYILQKAENFIKQFMPLFIPQK